MQVIQTSYSILYIILNETLMKRSIERKLSLYGVLHKLLLRTVKLTEAKRKINHKWIVLRKVYISCPARNSMMATTIHIAMLK
jgi:hypothetical protein